MQIHKAVHVSDRHRKQTNELLYTKESIISAYSLSIKHYQDSVLLTLVGLNVERDIKRKT